MKKIVIAAIAASLALIQVAAAQDQYSSTINSGPWMMRKSTGNKTTDRVWFIMDRTLNSVEQDSLRSMFRSMPGNTAYVVQKAICNAIDSSAYTANWSPTDNGMGDYQVYHAMTSGLRPEEQAVMGQWLDMASDSQMDAVAKLVRCGGWANAQWTASGMNN